MEELHLDNLQNGVPGISEVWIACYIEAAKVALLKNEYSSGVVLEVVGDYQMKFTLLWSNDLNEEIVNSWKNNNDAAELGAIAIAILLVQKLTSYRRFEISEIGTGIDFWLLENRESQAQSKEAKARLEVSGIFEETPSNTIAKRTRKKLKQIKRSDYTKLPGIVVVTSFKKFKSKFIQK